MVLTLPLVKLLIVFPPLVTPGSTAGVPLMLGGMGAIYGLVTYSEYKSEKKLTDSAKSARLKEWPYMAESALE